MTNKIQYYSHILLHSKVLPLLYLCCIMTFFNLLSSTTLCEADNDNIIKNEIVKKESDTTIALILFSISIFIYI